MNVFEEDIKNNDMPKGKDKAQKSVKKEATKSLKEKRADKEAKRKEKKNR